MGLLHKSHKCDQCESKFDEYQDLIDHAREVHHHPIVKCRECGKEFVHEKDRLHHAREEHEKKIRLREEKQAEGSEHHQHHGDEHHHRHGSSTSLTPQEEVDAHNKKFSDNFG